MRNGGLSAVGAVVFGAIVVGCAAAETPGWTYAPVPSATPVPSVSAAGPSPSPQQPSPGSASVAPGGTSVAVAAHNIKFDQAELRTPAGASFTIVFDNQEAVPHNVAIYTDSSAGSSLFVGEIFAGPGRRSYTINALAPGSYFFRCDVHPTAMTGTLVVE